ncbi:MAG: Tim44/TimA family putative adaptor protein [Planktomarina sp.]|jgi:predicted lipid-binding transport protein (Tim44 family)|nr:Tim44/TimA family putative adaptor protein [Planktomarina sp.]
MNSPLIQLLVLAGIAVFLILKLRGVLGTRDGYEAPRSDLTTPEANREKFAVIDGGPDQDITDHADEKSSEAKALAKMKAAEPSFSVSEFLQRSKSAYEWILMSFENGDIAPIKPYLADDVYEAFSGVVASREEQGLTIEAEFIGVSEVSLVGARFNAAKNKAEVDVRFVGELTSIVRDNAGLVIEGSETEVKRQRDVWTFSRVMGSDNPNWQLVTTGE